MNKEHALAVFENYEIRRIYNEKVERWYFSVIDIIAVLIQQSDCQTARKYWNKLKSRLKKEGSQSVTDCHQLKLEAADGKKYLTDYWKDHEIGGVVHFNHAGFNPSNSFCVTDITDQSARS